MPVPAGAIRPHLAHALRGGVVGALLWVAAGWLGLPAAAGLPLARLLPVAALLGAACGLSRVRGLLDVAAGGLVLLMLAVGFTPALHHLVPALIDTTPGPPGQADAVVVLSGAVSADGLLSPSAVDRLLHGIELLRHGGPPVLVTSRVRVVSRGDTTTSDRDQARLLALAPDTVRWLIVDSVWTTRDEAVRVAALAAREGWRHLVLVTSPLHTRRACAAFRQTGLGITCAAAPSREMTVMRLHSAADRIRVFGPWLYETLGWRWYRVRGWVVEGASTEK